LALAEDRIDIAGANLLLEHGVRDGQRLVRSREQESDEQKVHEQDKQEPQPRIARRHRRLLWMALVAAPAGLGGRTIRAAAALRPRLFRPAAQVFSAPFVPAALKARTVPRRLEDPTSAAGA